MSVSIKLPNVIKKISDITNDESSFGVAVSGGGDSIALLHLLVYWAEKNDKKLDVITVDHNLRDGSDQEAVLVQKLCKNFRINHSILKIQDEVAGNLQSWARDKRYSLISDWAYQSGISNVFLGHTLDDQAETFLLRLARGSGVDGLSAMTAKSYRNGINWLRPLLTVSRKEIRTFLKDQEIPYVDDPSNDDVRFDRIKVRKVLANSYEYGLKTERLVETSLRMRQARDVLNQVAFQFARKHVCLTKIGSVKVNLSDFTLELPDTRYRIMSYLIKWVSGNPYGARAKTLENVISSVINGKSQTCCGCIISNFDDKLHISREFNAVENIQTFNNIWDGRWLCPNSFNIKACGEAGLKQLEEWKRYMLPRHALLSMPTIWKEEKLTDHLLKENQHSKIRSMKTEKQFYDGILSY